MQEKIFGLFDDYSQKNKLQWGRVFNQGIEKIKEHLFELAQKYKLAQESKNNTVIWNKNNKCEAMFVYIHDPSVISSFKTIYSGIEKLNCPVAFIIVRQTIDGEGIFDIFRFSNKSYLEHNNRARYRK